MLDIEKIFNFAFENFRTKLIEKMGREFNLIEKTNGSVKRSLEGDTIIM